MRAVSYPEPESFAVVELPDRPLAAGEVRAQTIAVGLCGTDLHLHHGENMPVYPLTPGHEIVAEIVECAPDVDPARLGERVAVDNVIYCLQCENCRRGDFNFCLNRRSHGTKLPGGFAEHIVVPARNCHPIGDMPTADAVLIEPTACAVHGVGLLRIPAGASVLVVGAGPTGQILAQLLAGEQTSRVVVAAPTQWKLDIAKQNGATDAVLLDRADFSAARDRFTEIAPLGFDVVIDATGVVAVMQELIGLVRSGGTLMLYGISGPEEKLPIPAYEIFRRQITIVGSFAQQHDFPRAIALIRAGRVRSSGIISTTFALDDYADALASLSDPTVLKAVVTPNGDALA
ncbi:zinc-dependent alcohol dehydrogenase family protein [Sphaerisporangium sp. NPDC051011]|uniref:zinc-dependent alcohol dehydrogenase family protein n=1 Tax=Sphaerisporangium sp. NPDC051011 TaxID=3155792 RepID=UPI0034004FF7